VIAASAPEPKRRRLTRGMPQPGQPIAVVTTTTTDRARIQGLLAFGLELLERHDARHRRAVG